jgi:hypothetical protein
MQRFREIPAVSTKSVNTVKEYLLEGKEPQVYSERQLTPSQWLTIVNSINRISYRDQIVLPRFPR